MTVDEMSRIERKVVIHAPRERVWRALTTLAEFGQWFGVKADGEFQAGARVRMVSTHPGYEGMAFEVAVEKMEPPHTFSWRWHPGAKEPGVDYSNEPTTLVTFHLAEVEGGTEVTVLETGFERIDVARRAKVFSDNTGGWEYQVGSIARYVHASVDQ